MKQFLPLIVAFILSSCVSSQRTIYLKAPSPASVDTVNVAAYEERYGKNDAVYLDIDESVEHSGMATLGGSTWDYHYVMREKYLVLNPDVERLTTFHLTTYRKADIGTLYLRVTSPDGTTVQYGIKDLIKEQVSENVVGYKFIYPKIVKGSVVDEGYELSYNAYDYRPRLAQNIPLQFRMPCERVSFSFAFPDWWTIKTKRIGAKDTVAYTLTRDSTHRKLILSCTARNVAAIKDEPYSPYFKEVAQYLDFMVSSLSMGPASYSAPTSWEKLIERYSESLTEREGRGLFTSRVQTTTDDLVKGKSTTLERLTAILDYVQSNIEIAKDTKDRDYADVLKDKKGDDYDLTGLTNMMLKKAGLKTQFLMVHSAEEGYFDSAYVSFEQLSVPAISARVGDRDYILLPYRKDIPFEDIPEDLQGQMCVVVSGDSVGTLRTLPSSSHTKNAVMEHFNLAVGEDGLMTVQETKTIQGWYAYFLRERTAEMKQTEKDKLFKDLISYSEGQVNISSYVLENEKEYKKPLVVKYTYTIDNLITVTPDEVLFHTAGLFAPTSLKAFRVEAEERYNPIRIYNDDEYSKEIEIRYPDNWEMKSSLQPLRIENTFGSLTFEAQATGHVLKVSQERLLKRNSQPKESIAEIAKLTGSKASSILPTLVFARKP